MTRDELLVRVKQLINKRPSTAADDSGSPSNAEILQNIEEARQEVYHEVLDLLGDRVAVTTEVVYPSMAESVTLPSSAQNAQILYAYYKSSSSVGAFQTALQPIRFAEYANVGETGSPKYYVISANSIRLRPMPGTDSTIVLVYMPEVQTLSAATASPVELPAAWHFLYAYKAAIKLRNKNQDPVDGLEADFKGQMERIITNRMLLSNDNHIQQTEASNFWQG